MDLTPRPAAADAPARRRRRWGPAVVLVLAVVAGGVVVTQFLTNAIDYYCNVDEVGTREGCEGDRRIRVQGVVVRDSLRRGDASTVFTLSFNDVSLDVRYMGDPGGVFQECVPVVAHGRIVDGGFESDRIEVKHTNEYAADNGERLDEADAEAAACSVLEG